MGNHPRHLGRGTDDDSAPPLDYLIIIELPSRPESLHFRAYAEPVGEASLLDWAIQRVRHASAGVFSVYVLAERSEWDRVERALADDSNASLWPASVRGQLRDLDALARATGKAHLLLMDITAALLPRELLERWVRHHSAGRNHATSLVGLPCAVPPVLIDAQFLSTLVRGLPQLPSQMLPPDVRLALASVEGAAFAAGERESIRVRTMASLSAEEQTRRRWPYGLRLGQPDDIEILRRVLDRCGPGTESSAADVEPLDAWIDVARQYEEVRLTEVHVRPPRRGRDRNTARRVLYAQSPSAFTGVEQVLVHLASAISRHYPRPFQTGALVALSGTLTDRLAQVGVDVHIARRDFAVGSVENYLYSRRMLNEIRPGLVHAHTIAGVPFVSAVAESGVPFVQHVHVASEGAVTSLADQITFASAVIAISDFVNQRLTRLGTDPKKIHVIRNGIPLLDIRESARPRGGPAPLRTRQAWGITETAPIVLMPARFAANKRHDIALGAFARLHARLPHAHLLMAGETFEADRSVSQAVESTIDRLQLRGRVHRVGFWLDMRTLYAAADVLLLPSEDDPLPLTVLEAMAAGVPVVAARSGGTPEMVEHDVSGLLVEPGNADGFATALVDVLTDRERRESLVAGALTRCRAEFSLSRFVRQVGQLYERVLVGEPVTAGDV